MAVSDELSELVNSPTETLTVEYKAWLELKEPRHRAALARHIAALANSGGGWIVFGIEDDGTAAGPPPSEFALDHDVVAGIAKRYLDPAVHCEVRSIAAETGLAHPVIIVPSHGAVPICAKANGPEIGGKITGIAAGRYYIRKPGPESAAIDTASDWTEVIRRCALHERSGILAAISAALSPGSAGVSEDIDAKLATWAAAADAFYAAEVAKDEYDVPVGESRLQLSYVVETNDGAKMSADRLEAAAHEVNSAVSRRVHTGWSLFHPFTKTDIAPYWIVDSTSGLADEDFLESCLLREDRDFGIDLWRLSRNGFATHIREFWEDARKGPQRPKASLDPTWLARTLGELVYHADAFSAQFPTSTRVYFRCEWRGLAGRSLWSLSDPFLGLTPAKGDRVVSRGAWPVADLSGEIPAIVAELGSKVIRQFGRNFFTSSWVTGQMPTWPQR